MMRIAIATTRTTASYAQLAGVSLARPNELAFLDNPQCFWDERFVLTNNKIDKSRLAKRQTKIKKERRQNKKQKEHAARSGTRTRDLSHFGFVGDRITRSRSIQPRHLKCRSCSVCLYKRKRLVDFAGQEQARLRTAGFAVRMTFLLVNPYFCGLSFPFKKSTGLLVPGGVIICCFCCLLGVGGTFVIWLPN